MKNFLKILATSLFLFACGDNSSTSTTAALTTESFSTTYRNNTEKDFDTLVSNDDLKVTKSYLHLPTNNLYGNRIIVVEFNVKNENFDKKIVAAFDDKWIDASWENVPDFGAMTGTAYVRYLSSEAGRDFFSLVIHDVIFNQTPTVALKVNQGTKDSYVKIQLKAKDFQPKSKVTFSVADERDEVAIEAITADIIANGTLLKIDVDVKDLDPRKLFQIECFDCTGGDASVKTLAFISKAQTRTRSGAVFNSESNGRENISLFIQLPNSNLQSVRSLRLTYLAPGYFGTPTHGAYDGIFGTEHVLIVKIILVGDLNAFPIN